MGQVYIGTSGYSYKDWRGPFYPQELKPGDFMRYYSEYFAACEIAYTYHRMPDALTLGHLVDKSKGRVQFIIKAHQDMTHKREAVPSTYAAFREALQPLKDADVLGGILAHYPYRFEPNKRNRQHLERIRGEFEGTPVIAELRNAAWQSEANVRFLSKAGLSLCCVDEPKLDGLLPASNVVPTSPGYVRFHGRNTERWFRNTDPAQRYDYRYSDKELGEWVPRIQEMSDGADRVYVFLGNLFAGQAVENARRLQYLLESEGVACVAGPRASNGRARAKKARSPKAARTVRSRKKTTKKGSSKSSSRSKSTRSRATKGKTKKAAKKTTSRSGRKQTKSGTRKRKSSARATR